MTDPHATLEAVRKLTAPVREVADQIEDAHMAGWDCAVNGPNTTNCHFRYFATSELTVAWEEGKAAALAALIAEKEDR